MRLVSIFLSTIAVITSSDTLCRSGCRCSNDDSCQYYCKNNICQDELSYRSACMGHNIHPRECGFGFCDPSNNTCQFKTSIGEMCKYDWACYSEYCDLKLQTCQYKSEDSSPALSSSILVPLLAGSIGGPLVFMIIIFVIVRIKQGQRNANPPSIHVIAATIEMYTVETNTNVQESLPPSYSESVSIPPNTTINKDNDSN